MDTSNEADADTVDWPLPPGEPTPAIRLRLNNIVIMPSGTLRAVTALRYVDGTVHVRLGGTWYAYTTDQSVTVAHPPGAER
jgi:hypothetical protein